MDIVVTGLHTEVPDRFRRHVEDKLAKIEQLSPRVQRVDVKISHESNPRQADTCERVELTVKAKGPVIRAEACADDPYAALDLAQEKLLERLRRLRDRGKVHHGRRQPASVRSGDGLVGVVEPEQPAEEADDLGESPIVIREKTHAGPPMSVQDALDHMELVGHDFYLFCDTETGKPSVVYRRRGWSYGVLRLETTDEQAGAAHASENGRGTAAEAAAAVG
ncbi:ribosome-associated translation inhibitor RaiA [Angustibacter speluncae]